MQDYTLVIKYADGDCFSDNVNAASVAQAANLAQARAKELSGLDVQVVACYLGRLDNLLPR